MTRLGTENYIPLFVFIFFYFLSEIYIHDKNN